MNLCNLSLVAIIAINDDLFWYPEEHISHCVFCCDFALHEREETMEQESAWHIDDRPDTATHVYMYHYV